MPMIVRKRKQEGKNAEAVDGKVQIGASNPPKRHFRIVDGTAEGECVERPLDGQYVSIPCAHLRT